MLAWRFEYYPVLYKCSIWVSSVATGQLACDVDNEFGGFDGHHFAANFAIFV